MIDSPVDSDAAVDRPVPVLLAKQEHETAKKARDAARAAKNKWRKENAKLKKAEAPFPLGEKNQLRRRWL